jgi:hypothetical protein
MPALLAVLLILLALGGGGVGIDYATHGCLYHAWHHTAVPHGPTAPPLPDPPPHPPPHPPAVPEPSSALLLLTAITGLALRRHRR